MINDLFPNAPFLSSDNRKYKEKESNCMESGCGCIFLIICIIGCIYIGRLLATYI